MVKMCYVTTVSMTLEAFILDLAKFINENGDYEITFICDYNEAFEKKLPSYINYIPIRMKRGMSLSGLNATYQLYRIFKNMKFDIVQYSTPNASLYTSIAARLAVVPVRLYCQWGIVYVGFSGIKREIFKSIERLICKLSSWIEPDSYGNLKFSVDEKLYTHDKSSVILDGSASGVNLMKFDINNKMEWRKSIRDELGIAEDTFLIGFVGRITRDKGINELLQSCKNIFETKLDASLILIGNRECVNTLNSDLYEWSINHDRVLYCKSTDEVEKYLASLDLFVLPSYREGFGTVVIEAEAMGIPTVVTNIPGPTDAIVKDETGICVEKGDPNSLEDAIIKLMNDKKMRAEMGFKGRKLVEEKFDSIKLYNEILSDRNFLVNNSKSSVIGK